LKDALARGADRAIHIVTENENKLSPFQLRKQLPTQLETKTPI